MTFVIGIIILMAAMIAGAFLWLGITIDRERKLELQTLAESKCPTCGETYGIDVAERSHREFRESFQADQKRFPDSRLNPVRHWKVCCSQCASEAHFNYETKMLSVPKPEQ